MADSPRAKWWRNTGWRPSVNQQHAAVYLTTQKHAGLLYGTCGSTQEVFNDAEFFTFKWPTGLFFFSVYVKTGRIRSFSQSWNALIWWKSRSCGSPSQSEPQIPDMPVFLPGGAKNDSHSMPGWMASEIHTSPFCAFIHVNFIDRSAQQKLLIYTMKRYTLYSLHRHTDILLYC